MNTSEAIGREVQEYVDHVGARPTQIVTTPAVLSSLLDAERKARRFVGPQLLILGVPVVASRKIPVGQVHLRWEAEPEGFWRYVSPGVEQWVEFK